MSINYHKRNYTKTNVVFTMIEKADNITNDGDF